MQHDCVSLLSCCVFFFQAEDGIRDHCVTGVQTCALPISRAEAAAAQRQSQDAQRAWRSVVSPGTARWRASSPTSRAEVTRRHTCPRRRASAEIGRASCRERGEISVVAGSLKKKKKKRGYI